MSTMEARFRHWIKKWKKKVIATFSHNSDFLFSELWDKLAIARKSELQDINVHFEKKVRIVTL